MFDLCFRRKKTGMKHLTLPQRYALKAYLEIGISKSTIYKKLKRNGLKQGGYNSDFAQELAEERKERLSMNREFTF